MLGRWVDLEGPNGHIIKVTVYLIEHLLVSVRVRFQGLPFSYGHGQQGVLRLRDPVACDEAGSKGLGELFEGVNGTCS